MMATNARTTTIHEVTSPRRDEVIRTGRIAFPYRKMNRDIGAARHSRRPRRGRTPGADMNFKSCESSRVARCVRAHLALTVKVRQRQILDRSGNHP
jgi:hypothetical protein